MTLNSTGPISLAGTTAGQSIEIELGGNGTTQISLNDAAVRTLAGVPSGAITMPTNFYGKSNRVSISYTFTSSTANAALNVGAISGYSSGKSDITVTVNGGVYLYATSTGSYGLNLTGGTTGDTVTLVNNGYIMGQGGVGNASAGGPALNVGIGVNITINNTNGSAYIGGGGGGGGYPSNLCFGGGGGAGGGPGASDRRTGQAYGGPGGGIGGVGGNGGTTAYCCGNQWGGGGGGRIFPGVGGAQGTFCTGGGAGGGAGGASGNNVPQWSSYGGSSNGAGGFNPFGGGGGGGWGASGGGGGAGGKAVNLNGKTVTWVSGNTSRVWGAVS